MLCVRSTILRPAYRLHRHSVGRMMFIPWLNSVVLTMFDRQKGAKQAGSGTIDSGGIPDKPATSAPAAPTSRVCAMIGASINIKGDVSGDENLVIDGKVEGSVNLSSHELSVGKSGRVNANIKANVIRIEGEVQGDITGSEKVIISRTGNVRGNIVAPRVTLEDGAKFKGSIDMDPGGKGVVSSSPPSHKAPVDKNVSGEGKEKEESAASAKSS